MTLTQALEHEISVVFIVRRVDTLLGMEHGGEKKQVYGDSQRYFIFIVYPHNHSCDTIATFC